MNDHSLYGKKDLKESDQKPTDAVNAPPGAVQVYIPKIMVVDDEAGMRDFITFELTPRRYEIISACDGEEAIEKFQGKNIDIVISDLTMPKKSGLDTLAALKAIDPKVEVIMVTGYATLENAVESMKLGAYDFITKPFQIDDLSR